jgi:hypothetical protein
MYTVLRATSKTLADYLEQQFQADAELVKLFPKGGGGMVVSLNTPEEMNKNNTQGLSVWLYRVVRDDQRLNDPPRRIRPNQSLLPPLPVRLHYLITPITTGNQSAGPETEQLILGKVLQAFHSHPELRGTDLQAELAGTDAELHILLEPMSLEEITRVWEALEGSYQLSVSYEVSLVTIEAATEPERITPVEVVAPEYGLIT